MAAKGSVKAAIDPAKALLEECGISCMNYPFSQNNVLTGYVIVGRSGKPSKHSPCAVTHREDWAPQTDRDKSSDMLSWNLS